MNPRYIDCETNAPTTAPSRRLEYSLDVMTAFRERGSKQQQLQAAFTSVFQWPDSILILNAFRGESDVLTKVLNLFD